MLSNIYYGDKYFKITRLVVIIELAEEIFGNPIIFIKSWNSKEIPEDSEC